jgi:ribosome-associated protein
MVAGSNPAGPTIGNHDQLDVFGGYLESVDSQNAGSREDRIAEAKTLALRIADLLAETPASDTVVLDIHERSSFADYFVICSGENERQLRAIANTVRERLADDLQYPRRVEGEPVSGWIVVDYGDVLVHVFDVDQREFYRLEDLWSDAVTVLAIQ